LQNTSKERLGLTSPILSTLYSLKRDRWRQFTLHIFNLRWEYSICEGQIFKKKTNSLIHMWSGAKPHASSLMHVHQGSNRKSKATYWSNNYRITIDMTLGCIVLICVAHKFGVILTYSQNGVFLFFKVVKWCRWSST